MFLRAPELPWTEVLWLSLPLAGVFAIGFFMRPLGGWLFGWIADKHGRKTSMLISVLMMCAGSLMIAVHRSNACWSALISFTHTSMGSAGTIRSTCPWSTSDI